MKIPLNIICFILMAVSCSGNSSSPDLTWYNHSSITGISEDPDHPEELIRVSIGISAQVFYISKKSPDYRSLMEKIDRSLSENVLYDIGIENKTNRIREIREIK